MNAKMFLQKNSSTILTVIGMTVVAFAANSSHQADYCLNLVTDMKFKSEEPAVTTASSPNDDIVFYDVEVFPNLFLINWKTAGSGQPVVRMINPTPSDVEELLRFKLVGFNCRRYDTVSALVQRKEMMPNET